MNNHQKPIWAVNLKKARKLLNLTQEQVSEKIHKSRQAYTQYENGEAQPDIETWHNLCNLFRIVELLKFLTDDNYFNDNKQAA